MKKIPVILLLLIQAAALVLMTCGREGPLPPPDKTPPYIKTTIPANNTGNDGTAGFALDGSIVITFTKDMNLTTINNQTVTVIGAGGIGPINGSVVYNNGSAIFTPAQKLAPNTAYTVMIDGSVSDSFGIIMGNTYTFIFITQALPDTIPPTVLYTQPEAASTDVAVNSNISIQFSKPVTASTLTFQLVNQSTGSVVSSTMNYTGTTAIFTPQFAPPAISLDGNTVYGATVKAGLQDLVGNQMVSDYTWTFSTSTGFDTTPPFVTATTPTAGVSGVSIHTDLMAKFSEPVDQTTINITLFSTATGTPVIVPYIYSYYDNGTNSLYYMPQDDSITLAYNTLYTARVSGVQDLAKNVMPDMTWSFTTELAQTSISVDSSNNPTQYLSPVTFTATVSSNVSSTIGIPTGTVTFRDNNVILPNGTVALSGDTATYTISTLALGTHTITATYDGDAMFGTSTSAVTQTVGQGTTTTTISAPTATYGSNGIVTVTVSSASGVPIGNVSLSVDGGAATIQALSNGSTVFTIVKPSVGSYTLMATYSAPPQGNFQGSTASGTLSVVQGATTTTINAPTITYGVDGNVTVLVSSASGTPTGNVSLSVDGGVATTKALNGSGSAAFLITAPSATTHSLTASYAAQPSFLASTASGNLTVNQAPTTMLMTAPTVSFGSNGIVKVTVTSSVPGVPLPIGNVSLVVDGSATPMLGALIASVATFTITQPIAGTHTLAASYPYPAGGNFGPSTASGTLNVGSGGTNITISSLPTITYGTNGVFTVTVSSPSGIPIGDVSLSDTISGATTTQTQTLSNGSTVFTISIPIVGLHNLVATYAAQGNFLGSTKSGTLTVNKAAATTSIPTSSANPSLFNNSVTFTATVSGSGAVPTGTVTFKDGSATLGSGNLSGSGVATFSTSTLSVATHSITAVYGGDTTYNTSTSAALSQIVNRATTTTNLTSSAGGQPVTPGTLVTFTATLNPAAATGTVTFSDNGVAFPSGTVALAAGSAAFGTTTLSAGAHNITAVYNGDTNYATSTSNTVVQSVANGSLTSITVVSSLPTSTYGNSVSFIVTVVGSGAIPTGTVTFKDGVNTIGAPVSLSGGSPDQATVSTAALATGAHSITAVYNGDASYSGGQVSTPITQTVIGTTMITSVISSSLTSTYGNSVTFTATVTGTGGIPTGNVSFLDGGVSLGAAMPLTGGSPDTAAFTTTTTALNAGVVHSITAVYNGNAYFTASTSAPISQNVNPAPTTMSISAPSVASGASGTVYVTVSSGILLPTGNVYLSVDGGTALIGTLSSGVATFSVGILSVGNHSLSATYAAQGNFGASSVPSGITFLTVGLAASSTSIALTGGTNPSGYGDSVTFTATVTTGATGSVTFKDGSTTLGSSNLSGGVATFSTSILTVATHNITAKYNGDANYGTSTSSNLQQFVTKASSATSLDLSLNPSTFGQSVTFTATVTPSTATGTVTFKDGSTTIVSGALSGGVASFSTSTLTAAVHTIKAVYSGDTNYLTSQDALAQTVNKAVLTVTANSASRAYGAPNPAFTPNYSGFVNGENSSVLSGAPSLTTTANATSPVGGYTITAAQGTLAATNYSFSLVNGTLTVTQASTITTVTGPFSPATAGPLTFTATVAYSGTGSAATGTVTFSDSISLGTLCVADLSGGTASCGFTINDAGLYSITATYSGETNYSGSVSLAYPLTVN